ncbi:MAG TPA: DUF2891 family protein, partial [Gammaproteobacteria bacterium]|nr:DUF2891 family protein [Gammaproteobacteria bacterium]
MSAGGTRRPLPALTAAEASDLAGRALANIAREYPNHPQYLLESDADTLPPRVVHPVFFGCFDWHSAVHSHWLLVRLVRVRPDLPLRPAVEAALDAAFVPAGLAVEAAYLGQRPWFERPYGLAWAYLLVAEAEGTRWAPALGPFATVVRANLLAWLRALRHPVRSGTHHQTAFALTLLHDAAHSLRDAELSAAVRASALACFRADTAVPLRFEPSGEDFLSPALMSADLMRRVLPAEGFAAWLAAALPELPTHPAPDWLPCAEVRDETDGKEVHLHGLNLSRAWNLANLADALPAGDPRAPALRAAAE